MLYGRRQGRALKTGKKVLLDNLLPRIRLTIENDQIVCPASLEGYKELWLEIGFGNGDHLAYLAEKYPHVLMIGCEPFLNGVGTFLSTIEGKQLTNVRLFTEAAQSLLTLLPPETFYKVFLLFPDPWPKKRHHKRRFVTSENLSLLASTLEKGAEFLFATDHEEYREWALDVFKRSADFQINRQGFEVPPEWVETRFQQKGIEEGRPAYFVHLKKP